MAVALQSGRAATIEDDYEQAVQTAGWLLGEKASEADRIALVELHIEQTATLLRDEETARDVRVLSDSLRELRRQTPRGIVVLDSRRFDELLGRTDRLWIPVA